MYKALVVKELRESAGLAALAGLAAVFLLGELTGVRLTPWSSGRPAEYPFVSGDELYVFLWIVGAGLGGTLGLKQTAWELWQGTYFFLLHRPGRRRRGGGGAGG